MNTQTPKHKSHSFYFKEFAVRHDRCTMKVGTDGVLLGAWVNVKNAKTILDIGTGSGVIALMLAQRTDKDVKIDAVEISESDAHQAIENVASSPWPKKINIIHSDLKDFVSNKKYDLIVSNPPFFINSTLPPSEKRIQARHTSDLSHEELLSGAKKRLSPQGKFAVILPTTEGNIFGTEALKYGLHCIHKTAFYSRKEKPQERWLMAFGFDATINTQTNLVLYDKGENWSEDYVELMREFYLKA